MFPPPSPPFGPRSMMWSATLITSKLCSITTTVSPLSTILFNIVNSFFISWECNPVVGSSNINKLFPVGFFCNSLASFTRAASPPDRVGALWPNFIYPNPTSCNTFSLFFTFGWFSKNSTPNKKRIIITSEIFFHYYYLPF